MIGTTAIDLENRRHSDLLFLNKETIQLEIKKVEEKRKEFTKMKIRKCKGRGANDPIRKKFDERDKKLKERRVELNALTRELKQVEQVYAPIEYRELYHP